MRITSNMMHRDTINSLNNAASLMNKYNKQLLSGKKVSKASDDPIAMTSILNSKREIRTIEQFEKNVSTAKSHLQTAEGALTQISDIISRVNELTVQGANGTYDEKSRQAISDEILELKKQIGTLANTKYGDHYLFGGVDTKNAPFDTTGNTWAANPNANKRIEIEISEGVFVPLNIDGEEIFNGAGIGRNIFDLLDDISTDILNGDADSLNDRIGQLDDVSDQLQQGISHIGSTINRIDIVDSKNDEFKLYAQEDLSNKEDADVFELYINLKSAETAYKSGLSVSSKILQTSLLDYLR